MFRGGGRLVGAPPNRRVGLVLVAVVMGAVLPWALLVAVAGAGDATPSPCVGGGGSLMAAPGQLVYADRDALWVSSSDLAHPRRLVDYSPSRPAAPSPAPSLSAVPSAAPAASPQASLQASPAASASPGAGAAPLPLVSAPLQFTAAALAPDLGSVAFVVVSPPGAPGMVSLRVAPLAATAGAAAAEAWSAPWPGWSGTGGGADVQWLSATTLLFTVPSAPAGRLVGVVTIGAAPVLAQSAPESGFLDHLHSQWPETRSWRPPATTPGVAAAVLGPRGLVAGLAGHDLRTPLASRQVIELVTGHQGSTSTSLVCSGGAGLIPAAFSPDGRQLAFVSGNRTLVARVGSPGVVAPLLAGRVLDWAPLAAAAPASAAPAATP